MEDQELPISGKNIPPALLSAIIDLAAKQEALTNLVIDYLVKKGENEQALLKIFDDDYLSSKDALTEQLYSEYGDTPLLWMIGRFEESGS